MIISLGIEGMRVLGFVVFVSFGVFLVNANEIVELFETKQEVFLSSGRAIGLKVCVNGFSKPLGKPSHW